MNRSILSLAMITACLVGGSTQITACSSASSGGDHEKTATGTLRMPLITEANGHTYRLRTTLQVYGPSYAYLSTDGTTDDVLTTILPTGDYYGYLYGWSLERRDDAGNYQPVVANLLSSSYVNFSIYNQSSTTLSFQFQTDGVIVTVGAGQLNVQFGVTEVAPACTVLGSDCPTGLWCPPPGLTGTQVHCAYAGSLPVGSACEAPTDCVANSTCIDLGSGPVCAALCDIAAVNTECSANVTCTKANIDYGVCVPAGGSLPPISGPDGGVGGFGGFPSATGGRSFGVGGARAAGGATFL